MNRTFKATLMIVAGLGLALQTAPTFAAADATAAKAFAKKKDCFKCHAIDKTKKGPSYQKISAMFKEKSKTDAQIFEHLTSSPKVKLEDGTEEEHKGLNPKDKDSINNLIMWLREQ